MGVEEAQAIIERVALNNTEEQELLAISSDCFTYVSSLADLIQRHQVGVNRDMLDQLTIKLKVSATSLTLFNGRYTLYVRPLSPADGLADTASETSGPSNSDTISVASTIETKVSSIFDESSSTVSSTIPYMEPFGPDGRAVAEEFLKLNKDEASLGPLLAAAIRKIDTKVATYQLHLLFETYCMDLLQQVAQQRGMELQSIAADLILIQIPFHIDRIYTEYVVVNQDTMLDQLLSQIPGERTKEKEDRTAEISRIINKNILNVDKPPDENERRSASTSMKAKFSDSERVVFAMVKDFLVSGRAFAKLRLAFRSLIRQEPLDIVRQEV